MPALRDRIGFMQGRLSPIIDGRIQCFPRNHWRKELAIGAGYGFSILEWTLDQERLNENPLMHEEGQKEIMTLCSAHGFSIPSLTGDCFMQAPFWKAPPQEAQALKYDFVSVAKACNAVGIQMMVMPLVDNGSLEDMDQEDNLISFLQEQETFLMEANVKVVFESDFSPREVARFIGRLNPKVFGINYDTGNSAALGFDPAEEFSTYGGRIYNVHIKDRVFGGTTVPLGEGSTDFASVFNELARLDYPGKFILQTARASDENHADLLNAFRDFVLEHGRLL